MNMDFDLDTHRHTDTLCPHCHRIRDIDDCKVVYSQDEVHANKWVEDIQWKDGLILLYRLVRMNADKVCLSWDQLLV